MTRKRLRYTHEGSNILYEYQENIKRIRHLGLKSQLSEAEIDNVMEQCLRSLISKNRTNREYVSRWKLRSLMTALLHFMKKTLLFFMSFLVIIFLLYIVLQYKPIQYFIQSKLQDCIYPGMKILRKLFLPVISVYPWLTNFYDESCLVVNPFFRVPEMSCLCEDVRAIMNLTGENSQRDQYHYGIPFMVKINRDAVSWQKLKQLYENHSLVFDRDASHLLISSPIGPVIKRTPASFFTTNWENNQDSWDLTHVQWRCNRMEPTRLLRSVFGAPVSEPSYAAGVTIEKIVMVDGPRAPAYRMPTTDGTTVFIHQSSGSRIIVLSPANECKDTCATVSVELPANHILWFSWWYWRATSMPSPAGTSVSITYMGSYL